MMPRLLFVSPIGSPHAFRLWTAFALVLSMLGIPSDRSALAQDAPTKPNVIFILCDDLGWGDLGCFYQNTSNHERRHRTPMLDRMASEGIQMRAHYCPAPVCAPSRGTLLTGTHQGHCSIRDNQFDKALPDVPTLGTVMGHAGYTTAMIGKYGLQGKGDNASNWPAYPTRRGFDEFFGSVRHVDGHLHYPAETWALGNSDNHRSRKELWHNDQEISSQLAKCYSTDLFTAKAKQFVIDHANDQPEKPFFIYLAYDTPHAALQVPPTAYPDGSGISGGIQWLGTPGHMINTAIGTVDSYRHEDYLNQGWSDVEERFATMVRRIDNCVGDLLQTLRDLDIDENTLVVISSDNGPHHESYLASSEYAPTSFQSYGIFDGTKRDCLEGGIRMPTLAWWPDHIAGGRIDETPSQFHDWMTTFADLAGTPPPARADGVSLVPTLTGEGIQAPSQIYIEYANGGTTPRYDDFAPSRRGKRRKQMQVVHVDGYKGLRYNIQSHSDRFEIYNLKVDPDEQTNLAGSSDQMIEVEHRMLDRVLQLRCRNASAPRPYDDELIPAMPTGSTVNSHRLVVTPGEFPHVVRTSILVPNADVRVTNAWTDEGLQWLGHDAVTGVGSFEGTIEIPQSGNYSFELAAPADAVLRVHDAVVIDTTNQNSTSEDSVIAIKEGLHPISLHARLTGDGTGPTLRIVPMDSAQSDPKANHDISEYLVRQSTRFDIRRLDTQQVR
ncbi:MAG: sulfatase-like hydrolase/transferase [Planctomycetota bacterium]